MVRYPELLGCLFTMVDAWSFDQRERREGNEKGSWDVG
jgi:hypothetical protein